ncbi:MAG: restriction endonuclease subunit S [Anaerolineales bacterium]|nr:restriction endonuclease subunit S [Anaerolineales bacterium]
MSEYSQLDSATYWGELPEKWQLVPIRYGFSLIGSGTTPPSGQERYYGGTVPWVTTSELRENIIASTEKSVSELALNEFSSLKIYPPSSVLIAMYGATVGRVGTLGIPATVNQAVCVLAQPTIFEPKYTSYTLQASRNYLLSLTSGGGQPNLNAEKIIGHLLPCPPLSEQRAIATYLDRETAQLDALIAAKEELLILLAEKRRVTISESVTHGLSQSVLLRRVNIPWLDTIPENWKIERGRYLFNQSSLPTREEDEIVTCFRDGQVTLRRNRRTEGFTNAIKEVGYQGIREGQLVLHSMDAFAGAIGVSDSDGKCTPEYIICDPINDNIYNSYYGYLLREMALQGFIQASCPAVRERAPRIRFSDLKEMLLPVPPIGEQKAIVRYINKKIKIIDDLQNATKQTIALLNERRVALIAAAVSGQIRITE